jgi:hypothetical protein
MECYLYITKNNSIKFKIITTKIVFGQNGVKHNFSIYEIGVIIIKYFTYQHSCVSKNGHIGVFERDKKFSGGEQRNPLLQKITESVTSMKNLLVYYKKMKLS